MKHSRTNRRIIAAALAASMALTGVGVQPQRILGRLLRRRLLRQTLWIGMCSMGPPKSTRIPALFT